MRVRVMPIRRIPLRDAATFIAMGAARRARRTDNPDRSDEPSFVEVPTADLPDSLQLKPLRIPIPATPPQPMTTPPDDPGECKPLPDAMPLSVAAWHRAAQHPFTAGTHGPVDYPTDKPLPEPKPDHVLLATNYRASQRLTHEDRVFLAKKTAAELLNGGIERVTSWADVAAILPVFVVVNSSGKRRVIFDARALNALLSDSKGSVRYERVRDALVQAGTCTKLDVASAFRHVAVSAAHRRYLCFEVEGIVYRYRVLPFGVSWSPAMFFRALAPALARVRAQLPPGSRIVWYVDDLLVVAPDAPTLDRALAGTIDTLLDHGWSVSDEKTFPRAYAAITFLGLLADYSTGNPSLRVPGDKADKIRDEARALASRSAVRVHELQGLAGRLEFVHVVIPQVGFLRRGIDSAIAQGMRSLHGCVPVRDRLLTDLLSVAHAAESFTAATLSLRDLSNRRQLGIVYADASAVGWGALRVHPGAPMLRVPPEVSSSGDITAWSAGALFTETERSMSSGAREVRAIAAAIVALDLRDGDVAWHSDATTAVRSIALWRSRSDDIAQILAELWDLMASRNLRVSLSHVLRDAELMPVADWLSRRGWRDGQAEWGVASPDVAIICHSLRSPTPTADLFASSRNAVVRPFCSRWAEDGSIGDAFFVDWASPGTIWWAFPPLSQLSRFCHRLLAHIFAGRQAVATAAGAAAPPSRSWSVILLYPIVSPTPCFLSEVVSLASRDVAICLPSTSSHRPASASTPHRQPAPPGRQVRPGLRLLGENRRPAAEPPPWPLRAALIRVHV